MEILRRLDHITFRHAVATIGSYDGVHRGHAILLEEVTRRAREADGESIVITFEPHPRITLGNDEGLELLTTLDEKAKLIASLGVDYLVVIAFDKAFSRLSHEEFTQQYLIERLGIKELVVGYNHRFGHDKQGSSSTLTTHNNIRVTEVSRQTADGDKVSSTVIREALHAGDIATATRLLGHSYSIVGVCDSEGRIAIDRYKLLPPIGEYIAMVNGIPSKIVVEPGRRIRCCSGVSRTTNIEFI